jgi:HAD superfamily hydrolase (TIGR01549 family)
VIEAVIFDLDGTLVQVPIDYEALFEEFKRIMHVKEVHPLVDVVSRADGKAKELVFQAWDKAERVAAERIILNETGMGTYKEFVPNRKALVTLQGKTVVGLILKKFNLSFDFVVTREDSLFRVDQLTKAISLLNANKENVLFVGNTESDANSAEKAGCQFRRVK